MCTGEFTVIDYDHCVADGQVSELAAARVQEIDSYAEISYSGTGIHQIAIGQLPRNIKQSVEMYDNRRFMTWTGKHLLASVPTVEHRQEQITALFEEIAPPAPVIQEKQPTSQCVYAPSNCSDDEILHKARNAANGAKFQKLWAGDASDYRKADGSPDHSRADAALCEMLKYWTDGDAAAIDRLSGSPDSCVISGTATRAQASRMASVPLCRCWERWPHEYKYHAA